MDKSGRRPLVMVSASGTFLGCFITGIAFLLKGFYYMEMSEQGTRGKQHMWTAMEDKVLVDCLLTMKLDQKYIADNGFKSGFANVLQTMMEEKLPGCGIKACPHITSRLKTMKRLWQAVHDMVYGANASGFGWDPDTKLITADTAVWDDYLKAHPRSAYLRTKSLPNFEALCIIWGKDRAVGDEGRSPGGMEEDVNLEDDLLPKTPHSTAGDDDDIRTLHDATPTPCNGAPGSIHPKKKRKLNHSEIMAEVLRETVTSLDKTIVTVFDKLGDKMSDKETQAELKAQGSALFMELLEVQDLTWNERNLAHIKIIGCEKLLNAFWSIPPQFKPSWIRSLLQ